MMKRIEAVNEYVENSDKVTRDSLSQLESHIKSSSGTERSFARAMATS